MSNTISIAEVPADTKITTYGGRLVVIEPNNPPYFLEVDVMTDPMTVRKLPIDLDCRLPVPMHMFLRFGD